MAMGSSLVGGYRQGAAITQKDKRRSYMPMVNALGRMAGSRRQAASRGGGRRYVMSGGGESGLDRRSREREDRHQLEKAKEEEKYRYETEKFEQEQRQAEDDKFRESEEARRQETHETGQQRSEFDIERSEVAAGQEDKLTKRKEAYEAIKYGMMSRDPSIISAAFQDLNPGGQGDDISYETLEDGTRKVTGRPSKGDVPEFIFHPDGYVGVKFPGQDKPSIFKDADEAFKNVIAPMNPDRWDSTTKGTAKDKVTMAKNEAEADYKNRKLQADVHSDAHEAALQQFEADGYYQPALYDENKYWKSYNDYVRRATGSDPIVKGGDQGARGSGKDTTGAPKQYSGKEPPQGFPQAKQGPRGGWYVQKKGKWYPILEGKEQGPATPKGKGRTQMDGQRTADAGNIQSSGVGIPGQGKKKGPKTFTPEQESRIKEVGVRKDFDTRGKKMSVKKGEGELYKGTAPPPEYPDAQLDRDEGIWYYFDSDNQEWKEVRV